MVKKKGLKKFNISNRLAYTLMIILSIALLGIGVYAAVPNPGHGASEIGGWPTCGSGQVLGVSGDRAVCVTPSATDSRFTVDSRGLCYTTPTITCNQPIPTSCARSTRTATVTIPGTCLATDDSEKTVECNEACSNLGAACNGDVSSCSGGTSAGYVLNSFSCPGSSGHTLYCYCISESVYLRESSIPANTVRCV